MQLFACCCTAPGEHMHLPARLPCLSQYIVLCTCRMALIETSLPAEVLCAAEGEKLPADAALTLKSPGMEPCRVCVNLLCCVPFGVLPVAASCSVLLHSVGLKARQSQNWIVKFCWKC